MQLIAWRRTFDGHLNIKSKEGMQQINMLKVKVNGIGAEIKLCAYTWKKEREKILSELRSN